MAKDKQTREPDLPENLQPVNLKYLETVKNFRLLDDNLMCKVFEDKDCTQVVIRTILENDKLVVKEVNCQYELKNLQGRSVRLDIYAVDAAGNAYDIEVQRWDKGANVRRARYNSSLMDANLLKAGVDYQNLRETYVIFITENDVLDANKAMYTIERTILETGMPFNDGSHIIYVNAGKQEDTPLGRLMHDFHCTQADDMHYEVLANRVRHFKENEEGVTTMCEAVKKLVDEASLSKDIEYVTAYMRKNDCSAKEAMDFFDIPEATREVILKHILQ